MARKRFSNVIGFDDAPFPRQHCGAVKIVGAVFASTRFDGVLIGEVTKDGADAAENLIRLIGGSKFAEHVQAVMLQGIAFGGFNVIDVFALWEKLGLPVLVVARKLPDMEATKQALITRIPQGDRKWQVIERLGPMEAVENVYVQRVGLTLAQAAAIVRHFAVHSHIPEPIRVAHLIAGALAAGESRGGV